MEMTSESSPESPAPAETAAPETQHQRWAKYGSNVALMIVLAVVVSALVIYIVQANDRRLDLSGQGVNSLKPQTINVLHDLGSDVRIISLYSKANVNADANATGPQPVDKSAYVSDLLDDYRRASSHISTEVIDPSTDKSKVDGLISDLEQRYGKELTAYKQYLDSYAATQKQLMQLTSAESLAVGALPVDSLGNDKAGQMLQAAISTVQKVIPQRIDTAREAVTLGTKDAHPDYKAITSTVKDALDELSQYEAKIVEIFNQSKDAAAPAPIHQYIVDSIPRHQQIQKLASAEVEKIGKLGELKVNDLERALNVRNPVVVLGTDDWRVLPESQIWPEDASAKMYTEGKSRPTFAGEQQITSAIVGLTHPKKQQIVFLRPGGPPLTPAGFPPFVRAGPLSVWAGRLRDANFDVLEKDLSGQWAMQQQMQQMPAPPEPDWSTINDAVWVVLDAGGQQQQAPDPIGPQLAMHLAHGGSAIVLVEAQADTLAAALKPWGVEIRTDALAVHQQLPQPAGGGEQVDQIQELLRRPYVWSIKDYGDAELAQPIRNLESLMLPLVVVKTTTVPGYTARTLLPLPTAPEAPPSWGETDIEGLQGGKPPTFDLKADIAAPIAAGAAVEKQGGGRLVIIGGAQFAFDQFLTYADPQIEREEYREVPRFPGNGELAMNAAYWTAKMDSMIALSPSALQVPRIANLAPWKLRFWRIGIVLIALPLIVLICGVNVYLSRRD
jgi:hypothetical protein